MLGSKTGVTQRFLDSTRGRVVARLRTGPCTVDELAAELGLTDNAIRQHLSVLERDGIIRHAGVRRGPGAGKPASLYEIHPNAEPMLSRAYAPALTALLEVLSGELAPAQMRKVLRQAGRRLADAAGGRATGSLYDRASAAASFLNSLGGSVQVEDRREGVTLQGSACPLATAVSGNPNTCLAVESMVGEIMGASVQERCEHSGGRHRCCFMVKPAA